MLPCSFIVFSVCEDKTDVDDLVLILDSDDQSVLVAGDVENRALSYGVGMRIVVPDFGQVVPGRFARAPIPVVKRFSGIQMFSYKRHKRFPTDDSHFSMFP